MKHHVLLPVLALTLMFGGPAWAQDHGGDVAASGDHGLFTLSSGTAFEEGVWSFGVYYNLFTRPTPPVPGADPLWNDWEYDQDRLSVAIGYAFSDRFGVQLMLPYDWYDANGSEDGHLFFGALNGLPTRGDIDRGGLGNLRVALKWQVTGDADRGFAVIPFVDLPTGDDDEGIVTGETGFGLTLAYTVANFSVNLGWLDRGESEAPFDPNVFTSPEPGFFPAPFQAQDTSPEISLGLGYAWPVSDRLHWISEAVSVRFVDAEDDQPSYDIFELTTGVRWFFGNGFAFNAGVRAGLRGMEDTGWGGLVGLTWSGTRQRRAPAPPPPPPVLPPPPTTTTPEVTPPPPPPAPTYQELPPVPTTVFEGCPQPKGKAKAQRWDCDQIAGSREVAYFASNQAELTAEQQSKLCDLVSQLRFCSQVDLCVAGRVTTGENPALAEMRANEVARFLSAENVASDRYQTAPQCQAEAGAGTQVDIFVNRR